LIIITKKRDEANLKSVDISTLNDNTEGQLLSKVDLLENQNEELLNQVDKLEGIRGALEEKVSAYRHRLKEVTKTIEDANLSSLKDEDEVVYHNRDNLERRRFIIRRKIIQQQTVDCSSAFGEMAATNELQEKYERLLEQYMYEHNKNEQLFKYLFQEEDAAVLELFVKEDAADTLLEATTLSRRIIQQAEEQARHIGSDLKEQLLGVLMFESSLPQEIITDLKHGLRCLEE